MKKFKGKARTNQVTRAFEYIEKTISNLDARMMRLQWMMAWNALHWQAMTSHSSGGKTALQAETSLILLLKHYSTAKQR